MNRITLPLIVACLGLGAWAAWEHLERMKLAEDYDTLSASIAETKSRAERLSIQEKENRTLTAKVAALEKEKAALEAPPAGGRTDADKPGAGNALAGTFAKMMSDPKMRDAMKGQARMGIDMIYRDLYDLLNLQEPQRSQLEKLINEKASAGMEAAFSVMGSDKTAEEKKAVTAQIRKLVAEADGEIKALLGEDDFQKVKRYEDSTMERMQLKTFNNMLGSKELPLDDATESKLMDAMYEERRKFPFASEFASQQNPDITRFTPENSARFSDEYAQLNERVAARAAAILPAPQLEVFRQSQEQQANMIKMQMEWGARMFGGEGPK